MKTVLITGASSGFGKACAEIFAEHGHRLILVARREDRLKKLQSQLKTSTEIHVLDVRDKEKIPTILENKNIDILINNAGLALGLEKTPDCNLENWETMIDTNIKGLIYFTHFVAKKMKEKNSGQIFNIGSVAGNWPYPGGNVYGATKAFVRQFSLNLRADFLGTNIRVTNVEPGMAETEFSLVRFNQNHDAAKKVYEGTKPLTAKDIAEIIFWISQTPEHININTIEVMPTAQAFSPLAIHRNNLFP